MEWQTFQEDTGPLYHPSTLRHYKTKDVKQNGCSKILEPFLSDVEVLEQHGVSVQTLGADIRGTVLCVYR